MCRRYSLNYMLVLKSNFVPKAFTLWRYFQSEKVFTKFKSMLCVFV